MQSKNGFDFYKMERINRKFLYKLLEYVIGNLYFRYEYVKFICKLVLKNIDGYLYKNIYQASLYLLREFLLIAKEREKRTGLLCKVR